MTDNLNEQQIGADLIRDLIREKRSEKRWKNIRFFIVCLIIFFIAIFVFASNNMVSLGGPTEDKGYVSYIKLEGMIEPGRDFSAEEVLPRLRDALSDQDAKGLILDINSGGGTPVQASIIHDAIVDMKKQYKKKVVVVGGDLLASGAYFVAVAADKIYVNPNTVTGSIGVIMNGFGFPDLIKKIGVERRVYTSGADKDRLDPFLPQTPQDIAKIRTVIDEIHNNFNQVVLEGRKGRLHEDPNKLFTGDFWSGQAAVKLGLVDGLGNLIDVMRKEFNVTNYKDYSASEGLLKSVSDQFGMAFNAALNSDGIKFLEKF